MDPSLATGYLCAVATSRDLQEILLDTGHLPTLRVLASSPYLDAAILNNLATHKDITVRRGALWRCHDEDILREACKSRNERLREAVFSNPRTPVDVLVSALKSGSFAAAINQATPEDERRSALDSRALHKLALTSRRMPRNASERRTARCWALAHNNPWLHELVSTTSGTMRAVLTEWSGFIGLGYLELSDDTLLAGVVSRAIPGAVLGVVAQRNPAHPELLRVVTQYRDYGGRTPASDNTYVLGRLSFAHGPRFVLPWGGVNATDNPTSPFSPAADVFLPGREEEWRVLTDWSEGSEISPHTLGLLIALSSDWKGDLHGLLAATSAI
jgi:hypothetical protein